MEREEKITAYVSAEGQTVFYLNKEGKFQRSDAIFQYTVEQLKEFCTPVPVYLDPHKSHPEVKWTVSDADIEKILIDSRSSYDLTKQVEQIKELLSLTSSKKEEGVSEDEIINRLLIMKAWLDPIPFIDVEAAVSSIDKLIEKIKLTI